MASPKNLQSYLDEHKIGLLFEELMGKVISEMPDDPLQFLIRSLHRKSERQNATRSSADAGETTGRKYDKPWLTSSKTVRPRTTEQSPTRRSGGKPGWNAKPLKPGSTFDELWGSAEELNTQPLSKSVGARPSPDEHEFLYVSHGYDGPRPHRNNDPLDSELKLATEEPKTQELTISNKYRMIAKASSSASSHHQLKQQQLKQRFIEASSKEDSGVEADLGSEDESHTIQVLENLDDLKREGVTTQSRSAVQYVHRGYGAKPNEAKVQVTICARCARLMSGEPNDESNRPDDTLEQVVRPESRQSTVRFSPTTYPDDDEFESVSQVTGPRQPVWQEDSDTEGLTPKRGQQSFGNASNAAELSEVRPLKGSLKADVAPQMSVNITVQSDDEDGVVGSGVNPWLQVPTDYVTDASSFYGSSGHKGQADVSGPY